MKTLTKEEREAARIDAKNRRLAQLAAEELARKERQAEFMKVLPKRLMDAQALANDVGVSVSVSLVASGPSVHFYCDDGKEFIDTTVTYETDEWEVGCLESTLQGRKEKIDAARARQQLAQEAFNKLSPDERAAVKEFIYSLR